MTKHTVFFEESMEAAIERMSEQLKTSKVEVFREALSLLNWMLNEYRQGNRFLIQRDDKVTELVFSVFERATMKDGNSS